MITKAKYVIGESSHVVTLRRETFHFAKPADLHTLTLFYPNIYNWEDAKLVAEACECAVFMLQGSTVIREYHPSSKAKEE